MVGLHVAKEDKHTSYTTNSMFWGCSPEHTAPTWWLWRKRRYLFLNLIKKTGKYIKEVNCDNYAYGFHYRQSVRAVRSLISWTLKMDRTPQNIDRRGVLSQESWNFTNTTLRTANISVFIFLWTVAFQLCVSFSGTGSQWQESLQYQVRHVKMNYFDTNSIVWKCWETRCGEL
jgi:hypothetical protein